jgi:DNA polymerase III subunit epsilon
MSWIYEPIVAFDLETTGVDPETDRIVSASTVHMVPGEDPDPTMLLVNPGIPIPASASAVHGITDADVANGMDPAAAVRRVRDDLVGYLEVGTPIGGMNLAYDMTLLDRECRRYGIHSINPDDLLVVDALILDKHVDRYRRGSRRLDALCAHYGVILDGAHNSTVDAIASVQVLLAIARRYPQLADVKLPDLHANQIRWAAEQAASFRSYLLRLRDPRAAEIDGSWPVRTVRLPQ